jgi:RND family efflux transporter MFP subunit
MITNSRTGHFNQLSTRSADPLTLRRAQGDRGLLPLFGFLLLLASCAKSADATQTGPAQPPAQVSVRTLAPSRVEASNEYLATLTSRRAVSLYPQVSAYVRSIEVKPGVTVKPGALLLRLDAAADQASLDNLVATRESLVANSAFAKDRQKRSTLLRGDGIVSQQDADQSRVQADQAEANVRATDALIASQRARLAWYTITAPFEGVVGNVPVKVGDFVGPTTLLTSVTQDSGLEAEISVPIERAPALTPDSRVELLDPAGAVLASSPVVFVSPRADPTTQLMLIKGAFAALPSARPDQVLRARVVWSVTDGLVVPTVSVVRQAGQSFVYVVEAADAGAGHRARRVPVVLGAIQGGDYVVTSGLTPGQQVVTSGLQQLSDGSPVEIQASVKQGG